MSRPIVVIVCMDAPPNRGSFNSAHIFDSCAGGGAVHSIKTPIRSGVGGFQALLTLNPRWRLDDSSSWCRSQGSWRTDNFEAKNLLAFPVAPIILNFTV